MKSFVTCGLFLRDTAQQFWFTENSAVVCHEARLESKVAKQPIDYRVSCVVELCCGGWVGFGSLLVELSQLVIALRLIMSGDVELNPGPLDAGRQLLSFLCLICTMLINGLNYRNRGAPL